MVPTRSLVVALLIALGFSGCAPWNKVTREPGKHAVANSASLESRGGDSPNYGCSFIEFDGKGGFLNFGQLNEAVANMEGLKKKGPVMLVLYAHGWQNNAQSNDVLYFLSFLRQMASTERMRGYRVQGVYLGWRGSQYRPVVDRGTKEIRAQLEQDFGSDVVDSSAHNPLPGLVMDLPKVLSYFSIKTRAEYHVSRVPLARAVFKLAFSLKAPTDNDKHRVFVLGHSFGALLLEQAIGQASVGLLSSEWTHREKDRWPFDLIVFLNSAAPSLYSKQLKEFLQEDLKAKTARPRIISITSKSDRATGVAHPVGNALNRWFATDLRRTYQPYVLEGETNAFGKPKTDPKTVTAGTYYARTPGHNPIMITRTIEKSDAPAPPALHNSGEVFAYNLRKDRRPFEQFYTWTNERVQGWQVRPLLSEELKAANGGHLPGPYHSNYWIVSADGTLIKGHGGIWTPECMEMLAGIYRMAEQLERVPKDKAYADD